MDFIFRAAFGRAADERVQELGSAWERSGRWKPLALKLADPCMIGVRVHGELGPGMKDFGGGGTGTALQLCFDGPRERRTAVFFEDRVCDFGVDVSTQN